MSYMLIFVVYVNVKNKIVSFYVFVFFWQISSVSVPYFTSALAILNTRCFEYESMELIGIIVSKHIGIFE